MRFWDTWAVVPVIVTQPDSPLADAWAAEDPQIVVWSLTSLEITTALCRLARDGVLRPDPLEAAEAAVEHLARYAPRTPSSSGRRTGILDIPHQGERMTPFGTPAYGLTRILSELSYDAALARVREALAAEGFGVLTEIDVRATLKKKLDVDTAPYVILGACNPSLAHRALQAEPGIGLLLPCNVVVAATEEGTVVSMADPVAMFRVVDAPGLSGVADDARARLERALAAL